MWTLLLEKAFVIFLAGRFLQRKKCKVMLSGEESLISEDSMPSLIGGDKDNLFDVEPHMQADHVGLARDAYRRQWTDLVLAEVATYFHGDMAAALGMWASAVYSQHSLLRVGNNFAVDYLSCRMVFPRQGLVQGAEYRPRLVREHVPHAPTSIILCPGLQALAMGNASINGVGGVIFDLTLMFHRRLTWRIDNLSAYCEYVYDTVFNYIGATARELSENDSEGS